MPAPRLERHEHPFPGQVVAIALEALAGQWIAELPRPAAHILPRHADQGLGGHGRKVDRDQLALVALLPAPGQDVQVAIVVWPAGALAELPLAIAEDPARRLGQERAVERR